MRAWLATFGVTAAENVKAVSAAKLPRWRGFNLLEKFTRRTSGNPPFSETDFAAAIQSMRCHQTQYTNEVVDRMRPVMQQGWGGVVSLVPAFEISGATDLFRER